MSARTVGILLYGLDAKPRDAFAEDKYRLLAEKMAERHWQVKTLTYQDSRRDALHREARFISSLSEIVNGHRRLPQLAGLCEVTNFGSIQLFISCLPGICTEGQTMDRSNGRSWIDLGSASGRRG